MKSGLFLLALALAAPLAAQSRVATAGAGLLIEQGLNRSEVMQNLQHLSDVIGPRLSGSPAMRRANEWTGERFRSYGLSVALEPYTFGVTWERGSASLHLTAPFSRALDAHSWAWTEGTGGKTLSGPVVLADLTTPESLAVYRDKVKGAWVLPRTPFPTWNPDGPEMTGEDSTRLKEQLRLRSLATADTSAAAVAARRQFTVDLPYILKAAGALGTLVDGAKEHGLMTMSGSPNRVAPLPNLVISNED
jgi:carboxypeptidase Q